VSDHRGPLLRVEGITKRFGGVLALEDVGLELAPAEHAALVGDNGAGKSTLVKVLSGALRPDAGRIWFGGQERVFHTPSDARQAGIETVYQTLALCDHLDVAANVFLGREELVTRAGPFSLLHRRRMAARAAEMLAQTGVNISSVRDPLMYLSGGQRQGVAIARAAGWGSRMIIMDEPTAALGVRETARVEEIIRGLKEKGIAVLMVSHNLRQVFSLVETIWVLRHGRMAGSVSAREASPEDVIRLITGADAASRIEFA
jgi:fructose transport system ATP-binding protein